MGWIFSGNEDVNIVGVVGSTDDLTDTRDGSRDRDSRDDGHVNNDGIKHYGSGRVNITHTDGRRR